MAEGPQPHRPLRTIAWILAAWFAWSLLVFYPNPTDLVRSLYRVAQPPVDPELVRAWATTLPDDPQAIEEAVREAYPYRHDWLAYNRPWYYPTTAEALAAGGGDCKTEYVLIAAIFEAKGIPYETRISLSHIWVDWEGRTARGELEYRQAAVWHRGTDGRFRWQLPNWGLSAPSASLLRQAWWELMPPVRRALFSAGSLAAAVALLSLGIGPAALAIAAPGRRRRAPDADQHPCGASLPPS